MGLNKDATKMNRRNFLGSLGAAGLGVFFAGSPCTSLLRDCAAGESIASDWPGELAWGCRGTKLNLKPVMTNIVHSDFWEGPCRWKGAAPAEEAGDAQKAFFLWTKQLKQGGIGIDTTMVNILEPVHITFKEDFVLTGAQLAKLKGDIDKTDAFFVAPWGSSVASYDLAHKFNKAIVMLGLGCRQVDIAAYTTSKGHTAFACADVEELNDVLASLRAKKIFTQTRILFPTSRGLPAVASVASINDLADLRKRFGVSVKTISYRELACEMKKVLASKDLHSRAEMYADELVSNARQTLLDRQYIVSSVEFYQAVTNLMARRRCNAFTIECFEFCSSRLPEQWKITPCLVHTVLKDQGFASSCEADLGALLAMQMLMAVSGKSSHMGNADPVEDGDFTINHSVPGLKMNGFDKADLAYKLGHFTESGWGTKFVVNLAENGPGKVTVARVNPDASGVLVLVGDLVGSGGWEQDNIGCSVKGFIRPPAGRSREFLAKRTRYGNHLPWVFGEYSNRMKILAGLLGLDADVVS
jgi:hypothetical protein